MASTRPGTDGGTDSAADHGAIWNAATGAIALVSGSAPHVLHHAGLLVGVAFLGGALGTSIFGVIGFAASIPFLIRLRNRYGTWRAPAIAVVVFAAMFTLSAVVVGPAISAARNPPPPAQQPDHAQHHG